MTSVDDAGSAPPASSPSAGVGGTLGVAYFGCRILRHVAADMRHLAELGFTEVVHTMSEEDMRFYHDQMSRIVDASHEAGLSVMLAPWGVGGLFGGEAASLFVAEQPDERQVDQHGFGRPAACPTSPLTRRLVANWATLAAEVGADSVLWDEPGWQVPLVSGTRCWCVRCREAGFGGDGDAALVDFLRWCVAQSHAVGLRSQVCPMPRELGESGLDDWSVAASLPGVHRLASEAYWRTAFLPPDEFTTTIVTRLRDAVAGTDVPVGVWLQGFDLTDESRQEFAETVRAARGLGVADLWVWGFEACGHMSELGTRQAERVWSWIVEELTAAHNQP